MGGCAGGGPGTYLIMLLPLALVFFMTRSQNKKQAAIEAGLKVGDTVISRSGLVGKLVELGDRFVQLEVAPGVRMKFLKSSIEGPDQGDPKDQKKDDPKKDDEKSKKDEPKKDDKEKKEEKDGKKKDEKDSK